MSRTSGRILWLVAALAVAAGLRFHGLGNKSLWFDEAIAASFLAESPGEVIRRSAEARAVHPPLSYLALQGWAAAFGASEFALRSLSAACGMLTVLGVYLVARELGHLPGADPRTADLAAPLAAVLVALSPLQVQMARQARGYSLAAALAVWGGWAMLRAARGGRAATPCWALAAGLGLAACYTYHPVVSTVVAQGLFTAALLRAAAPGAAPRRWVGPFAAAAALAIGYVGFGLPVLLTHVQTIRHDTYQDPLTLTGAIQQVALALHATALTAPTPPGPAEWGACLGLAAGLAWLAWRGGWPGRYLALTGALPALLQAAFSVDSARTFLVVKHLMFAQISWLLGAAWLVAGIRPRLERGVVAAWALGLSAFWCHAAWPVIGPSAGPGMRGAVGLVLDRRRPDEPIVSTSPFIYFGVRHYSGSRAAPRLLVAVPRRELQRGSEHLRDELLTTPAALLAARPPGVWVVTSESYRWTSVTPLEPPPDWEVAGRWTFAQDYYLEAPLTVVHYRATAGAGGAGGGQP
jgi:mannosyltransferase